MKTQVTGKLIKEWEIDDFVVNYMATIHATMFYEKATYDDPETEEFEYDSVEGYSCTVYDLETGDLIQEKDWDRDWWRECSMLAYEAEPDEILWSKE